MKTRDVADNVQPIAVSAVLAHKEERRFFDQSDLNLVVARIGPD